MLLCRSCHRGNCHYAFLFLQCIAVEEKSLFLQSEVQAGGEKEEHWRNEIAHLSHECELSQQQVVQLEGELTRSEEELENLQAKLRSSQRKQDLAREEVRMFVCACLNVRERPRYVNFEGGSIIFLSW